MCNAFVANRQQLHVTSNTALSMAFDGVPPRSEFKGYYTTLEKRNEQMESNSAQAMVASEMDTIWDPLEFTKTQSGLFFMRESEIKHCRLAMLVRTETRV